MSARIPHLVQQRQRAFWFIFCTFLTLLLATSQISTGRGAVPDLLPLPITVPVPEGVLFSDDFGASMAMDGDILAVGAPNTTVNGNSQQGLVYLYTRDSSDPTAFTLLKSITGSDSGPNHRFGSHVAIHGDTLVAGSHSNAAYVFERNQGGANQWGETKKLERDDNRPLTHFGRSLAIHGDTILVGAPLGLGDVFIFQRDQGGDEQWGKTQTLDSGLPMTTSIKIASFGEVIAFNGETIAISAPRLGLTQYDVPDGSPPVPANFVGGVFLYHYENGEWRPDAKLFSSDLVLDENLFWDDAFGKSLELNGSMLFIGAIDGRANQNATGKVFVYQKGSGNPPPYGEAGSWGEISHLSPGSGADGDAFGTSLYAVDDGLFVGAPSQGIGKVYFFRNPAGAPQSSVASLPMQAWSEIYHFSTSTDGSATAFGNPLGGSGSTVLIGNRPASGGSNDIYAYAKEALFAHDPNATATPTETIPVETPPPDEAEPCVPQAQTEQTQLYLPSIAGEATETAGQVLVAASLAVPLATPDAPTALYTGILGPGCVLSSPDGIRFAAVQGAITQSIAITIETVSAPAEALPASGTPLSNFLRISGKRNEHTQMGSPFVIAIPVPDGADVAHLVLADLVPPEERLDSETTEKVWSYIPGVYDAGSKLFLARLPYVRAEGTTVVLLQHPDFDSPANQPPAIQAAGTQSFGGFTAFCITDYFHNSADCTEVMEATVEGILDDIYMRMTDSQIFNYPERLRLLDADSRFIVSQTISVTEENLTYAVYLMGPKDKACDGARGYYSPRSGFLALCIKSGTNIDAGHKDVLIHEFFHAVQYTYPEVFDNFDFWKIQQLWIIEGMAHAAVNSYPDSKMQRSPYYGENALKFVDEQLTTGKARDGKFDEYLAQDFWVYLGLSENQSLGYLGPLLALGGSHQTRLDRAMQTLYGKSLGEIYWGWVKHQAIENTYDTGSGPAVPCELTEEALTTGMPVEFPSIEQVYPFDTQSAFDRLPPLTAKVIEIEFGAKISAVVGVGYERCAGITDGAALDACIAIAQEEIKIKVYEEGEFNCYRDDLPGVESERRRILTNISPDLRYFVVVANVDMYDEHGYYITVE